MNTQKATAAALHRLAIALSEPFGNKESLEWLRQFQSTTPDPIIDRIAFGHDAEVELLIRNMSTVILDEDKVRKLFRLTGSHIQIALLSRYEVLYYDLGNVSPERLFEVPRSIEELFVWLYSDCYYLLLKGS